MVAALLLLSAGSAALAASGAAESDLPLAATALVYANAGKTEGCGIRITGGRPASRGRSIWIDVSLNVYTNGAGVVQAIAYALAPSAYEGENRPERVSMQRAWVKPRESIASTRLGENVEARDSVVYAVTLDEAGRLFQAVATGQALVIGLRAWDEPREWTFSGTAELTGDARADIGACLASLVN
jgi:hypothetical protein